MDPCSWVAASGTGGCSQRLEQFSTRWGVVCVAERTVVYREPRGRECGDFDHSPCPRSFWLLTDFAYCLDSILVDYPEHLTSKILTTAPHGSEGTDSLSVILRSLFRVKLSFAQHNSVATIKSLLRRHPSNHHQSIRSNSDTATMIFTNAIALVLALAPATLIAAPTQTIDSIALIIPRDGVSPRSVNQLDRASATCDLTNAALPSGAS